jgi:hypothetical protein
VLFSLDLTALTLLQTLEERYFAIRTVESNLEERRRTFDRVLEDLTREKEVCPICSSMRPLLIRG